MNNSNYKILMVLRQPNCIHYINMESLCHGNNATKKYIDYYRPTINLGQKALNYLFDSIQIAQSHINMECV
jgi:protein associated with RNAse G/E